MKSTTTTANRLCYLKRKKKKKKKRKKSYLVQNKILDIFHLNTNMKIQLDRRIEILHRTSMTIMKADIIIKIQK